jgi:hypothetical protein
MMGARHIEAHQARLGPEEEQGLDAATELAMRTPSATNATGEAAMAAFANVWRRE